MRVLNLRLRGNESEPWTDELVHVHRLVEQIKQPVHLVEHGLGCAKRVFCVEVESDRLFNLSC